MNSPPEIEMSVVLRGTVGAAFLASIHIYGYAFFTSMEKLGRTVACSSTIILSDELTIGGFPRIEFNAKHKFETCLL